MRDVSGSLVTKASVLLPTTAGPHRLRVGGWRALGDENEALGRAGLKTAQAAELVVDLEIFFGSLKANGIGVEGFGEFDED